MSDELKLCPFCGGSNTTLDYYEISGPQELGIIVVCNDCGASAKSIVDWNTRPIEDALQAENEWLKEELQQEKTRSQLNLEAEERRMLNITYYCAEIDRLDARIAELEGFIGQLIEAGNDIALIANDILEFDGKSGEFTPIAEKWQALVKNRKEV